MSKFGVGVGEDFPVDENKPEGFEEERESRCGRRGDRAARHEAWHRFRDQMRMAKAELRGRRHGHHRFRAGPGGVEDLSSHHVHKLVIGGLALIGLAALLSVLNNRR